MIGLKQRKGWENLDVKSKSEEGRATKKKETKREATEALHVRLEAKLVTEATLADF